MGALSSQSTKYPFGVDKPCFFAKDFQTSSLAAQALLTAFPPKVFPGTRTLVSRACEKRNGNSTLTSLSSGEGSVER